MVLAQANGDLSRFFIPAVAVIVLSAFAFVVLVQIKKRMNRTEKLDDVAPGGFTLSDLRRLHKSGKMSDEEFEKAKAGIIAAAQRAAAREAAKSKPSAGRTIPGFDVAPIEQKQDRE